jgi:hypothetical protein
VNGTQGETGSVVVVAEQFCTDVDREKGVLE